VICFAMEQHRYSSIRTMDTKAHEMSLGDFEYMFGILTFPAATPEKACDFRIYGLLPEMGDFMAELVVSTFFLLLIPLSYSQTLLLGLLLIDCGTRS